MSVDRVVSVEVLVPGPETRDERRELVRYCDACRRWGAIGTTHLCGRNWRPRLSDLLIELAREQRR